MGAGLMPAAGDVLRHLVYGAALGPACPMLLLARRTCVIRPLRSPLTARLAT